MGLSEIKLRLSKFAILLGDVIAMALAFWVASMTSPWLEGKTGHLAAWTGPERASAWAFVALTGLFSLLMSYQHYSDRRPFWDEFRDFVRLVCVMAMLDLSVVALAQWHISRWWWCISWVTVLIMLISMRVVSRRLLKAVNLWARPTIIVGVGPNAAEAALALKSQPEMGLEVSGFVDIGEDAKENENATQPRFPIGRMPELAAQKGVQWVIALEHSQSDQREHWLRRLAQWNVTDVSVIPAMRGVPLHGTDMSHFFSHEVALLRMRNNLRRWPARLTKRVFDTLAALVLLLLLSPLMLVIALLIRRDSGPAMFAHPRVGKRGLVFNCYKFRTMVVNAEAQLEKLLQDRPDLKAQWEQESKLKSDPRVSRVGRFLRRTSLDELPQLLNVIRGEMSLVGPRPVVQRELSRYGDEVGYYLMVRPGMTGLWQVSGRNDLDYDTRVYLDTWYVKNWSLWHDQIILFKTISVVMNRAGAY
ncbi:UDP-phosphate galactose phosphotransferase [Limnohabitans sp. 2KL-1]|nr:UDP-phosphate galactose phosphotransferase [Limnohabitans sp. 2KL-1]